MSEDNPAATAGDQGEHGPDSPLIRVVRGTPDEAELAALTAAIAGVTSANSQPEAQSQARPLSVWADPSRGLRGQARTHRPGRGAWWASSLPR